MNDHVFHASQAFRLDSPERLVWLPSQQVIRLLGLRSGMSVADIGAGTGYFSLPIAARVGPNGKVYAADIQPDMLTILQGKLAERKLDNIEGVVGQACQTNLPATMCDLAFLANVWHELDDLNAVLQECRRILRPEGRIAIVDWRDDVSQPPGPPPRRPVMACSQSSTWR